MVTNPTSAPRQLELLLQIPKGSIPVDSGFYTKGVSVDLDAYGTTSLEYAFYFPAPGTMPHYPVHVAKDGGLVAFADAEPLVVVREASEVDTTSWQYVSQNAEAAAVLSYLSGANLQRTDLNKIAWRMRDAKMFGQVIKLLLDRHTYSDTLWSYGVLHRDRAAMREYLRHQDRFLRRCGRALSSTLVSIDPVVRHAYQQGEMKPSCGHRAAQLAAAKASTVEDETQAEDSRCLMESP